MRDIYNGELLALEQAHTSHHDLNVNLFPLDDGNAGGWDPSDAQTAAVQATQDPDAIAYIGDWDSGASATTLQITNKAGILQVSPSSPYLGLTDASPVDQAGEPGRYYPSGVQTFARLVPSDLEEAVATAQFMHSLPSVTSVYVLADDSPYNGPFDSAIAPMVAGDAAKDGITVAGRAQIDTAATTQPAGYASVVAAIAASHATAVFVGAAPDPGALALWQELYQQLPGVALFAPSTLGVGPFLDKLGDATSDTYVTSPILAWRWYPRRARKLEKLYQRDYRKRWVSPVMLYGYEAMESVLAAINIAGKDATKALVVRTYFHLGTRDKSVIGRYYITKNGDSSLSRFAGYRVGLAGNLIEIRRLNGAAG